MHIRLKFRSRHQVKPGDTGKGQQGALVAPEAVWLRARKAWRIEGAPVPQTDTGSQEEDSKANGRRVVKELGKLTP